MPVTYQATCPDGYKLFGLDLDMMYAHEYPGWKTERELVYWWPQSVAGIFAIYGRQVVTGEIIRIPVPHYASRSTGVKPRNSILQLMCVSPDTSIVEAVPLTRAWWGSYWGGQWGPTIQDWGYGVGGGGTRNTLVSPMSKPVPYVQKNLLASGTGIIFTVAEPYQPMTSVTVLTGNTWRIQDIVLSQCVAAPSAACTQYLTSYCKMSGRGKPICACLNSGFTNPQCTDPACMLPGAYKPDVNSICAQPHGGGSASGGSGGSGGSSSGGSGGSSSGGSGGSGGGSGGSGGSSIGGWSTKKIEILFVIIIVMIAALMTTNIGRGAALDAAPDAAPNTALRDTVLANESNR